MARGFPGDYICTIRVEPVPRNDDRPPLSFPLVSSRKSWSLDSLYREIYLSPPPPGGEEKVNGPPMRRNERQPKKKESGLNEDLKVSRLGFWWRGEEGKAGSPFSTVGGPRPHSRNRLQNVLFTWFEGALFQQGLLLLILILLRLSLFTRSNSVFSHLFFPFPFLSFFLLLLFFSNQFSEPEEHGGGVSLQGAISGRLSRQVLLLYRVAQIRGTRGQWLQVDDLLGRVSKVSHSSGVMLLLLVSTNERGNR